MFVGYLITMATGHRLKVWVYHAHFSSPVGTTTATSNKHTNKQTINQQTNKNKPTTNKQKQINNNQTTDKQQTTNKNKPTTVVIVSTPLHSDWLVQCITRPSTALRVHHPWFHQWSMWLHGTSHESELLEFSLEGRKKWNHKHAVNGKYLLEKSVMFYHMNHKL